MKVTDQESRKAHTKVFNAIRSGVIQKDPCVVCRNPKSIAHHEDYSRPLDVVWYCHKHHRARHREIGESLVKCVYVLQVRKFPSDVLGNLKMDAIDQGISLEKLVISVLTEATKRKPKESK